MLLANYRLAAGALVLASVALEGCSLDSVMASCADCGQVRSISARPLRNEIRLLTDAPLAQTVSLGDAAPIPLVYDVRIRMDRGGARDFVLSDAREFAVGDRVEVQGARIIRREPPDTGPLWL